MDLFQINQLTFMFPMFALHTKIFIKFLMFISIYFYCCTLRLFTTPTHYFGSENKFKTHAVRGIGGGCFKSRPKANDLELSPFCMNLLSLEFIDCLN